ncbi:very short patch repair endonuclease [Patulibacter americanus]|uniref:very short patch repair endonuclease n=1 Tax=Patulibacter americanus TaxID=588672 RepID=UPI0003B654B4|nr:very short patch repair endonuclease [Patulibacter americanus]
MPDDLVNAARPAASSPDVQTRMSRLGQRDTKPEVLLRQALHRRGLRFRLQRRTDFDRRRRIDIVFPREKVAIFVDGCFWHRCPRHATVPRANAEFWDAKLSRNVERDRDTDERLGELGWTVLRFWEHEQPEVAAQRIELVVRELRGGR